MNPTALIELMIEHYQLHKGTFILSIQFECLKNAIIESGGVISEENLAKCVQKYMDNPDIKKQLDLLDGAIKDSESLRDKMKNETKTFNNFIETLNFKNIQ